jgi:transposase-like protein
MVDRKRSESALLRLVREDFVNGASTGKIERLAKGLGIEGTSASKVSEITRGLDKRVEDFRTRPLQAEYSFIWVDVLL